MFQEKHTATFFEDTRYRGFTFTLSDRLANSASVSNTRNFGTNDKTRLIVLGAQQLSHVELFRTCGTIAEQTTKTLDTVQVICHNVVSVVNNTAKQIYTT